MQETQDHVAQNSLLRYTRPSAFYSPLLENSVAQTIRSPLHPVSSNALMDIWNSTQAKTIMRNGRLQLESQKVVVGGGLGLSTGASMGYAGWSGWLSSGLLGSFSGLEAESATLVGAVVALSSLRWAVGKWEREKVRWLEDWERITAGSIRDLHVRVAAITRRSPYESFFQAKLDDIVRQRVFAAPVEVRNAFEEISARRTREIDGLLEEIDTLSREYDDAQ
jgi:hypothetical protein